MSTPLILQIQQAAIDSNTPVTDALRKAKVAATKLTLTEFAQWVDLELNGYMNQPVDTLPKYRQIYGTPEGFNPYHGWQPILLETTQHENKIALAPIGTSIPAIEEALRNNKSSTFEFPYAPDSATLVRKAIGSNVATWQSI